MTKQFSPMPIGSDASGASSFHDPTGLKSRAARALIRLVGGRHDHGVAGRGGARDDAAIEQPLGIPHEPSDGGRLALQADHSPDVIGQHDRVLIQPGWRKPGSLAVTIKLGHDRAPLANAL